MKRIEDIVYYDFQGWPEYKMNLREKKPTDEQQAELARQADSHMSMEKLEAFIEALEKKENK